MLRFHVHSVVLFLALLTATTLCTYILYRQSFLVDPLLPREHSVFAWDITSNSDAAVGGGSTMEVKDASSTYDFDFTITAGIPYPYITYGINFTDHTNPVALANWTAYDRLVLRVKCKPQNVLSVVVHTYDDEVTRPEDFGSYRKSETFFSCGEQLRDVTIDLTRLETPEWWFRHNGVAYSRRNYYLDRVASLTFHNSNQSPYDLTTNVQVSALFLQGRDWRFIYAAVALNALVWSVFIYWYLRRKAAALVVQITEKIQQERPAIAYQQLPDDTKQDREKNLVLRHLATNYAKQDLNLDSVVADLGINRTKINAILKDELGLTFSAYINKIRLTEASRLLLDKEASVAEIAYKVGYNNASYFTTVFKKEYGCTPGDFRKLMVEKTLG